MTTPTQDRNVIVSRGPGRADVRIGAGDDSRVAAGPGQGLLVVALSDGVLRDTADVLGRHAIGLRRGPVAVVTLTRSPDR